MRCEGNYCRSTTKGCETRGSLVPQWCSHLWPEGSSWPAVQNAKTSYFPFRKSSSFNPIFSNFKHNAQLVYPHDWWVLCFKACSSLGSWLFARSYLIVTVGVKTTLFYFIIAACYILPLARSVQIRCAYSISVTSLPRMNHKDHQLMTSKNILKLSGTEDSPCNTVISPTDFTLPIRESWVITGPVFLQASIGPFSI